MTVVQRALMLLATLILLCSAAAHADESGRIEGQIVNGTSGAPVPAGLPVVIHMFRDRAKVGERALHTDEQGRFVVEDLAVGAGNVYLPVATYGEVEYFPERPVALDDAGRKSTEIRVYEPTSTDEAIQMDRSNLLILRVTPSDLTIMEMGAVVNRSDTTYVGAPESDGRRPTLRFSVPTGAAQITPQAGFGRGELIPTPDGFATTEPVPPGRHELAFSYQLPLDGPTLELARSIEYPTTTFNLYVPDGGLTVVSPRLVFQGVGDFGGQRFQLYTAQALARGTSVSAQLSGLPAPTRLGQLQLGLAVVGCSAVVLATAALVAIRRRAAGAARVEAGPVLGGDSERIDLLRALAELDQRFEEGEIDPQQYRAERDQGKARLLSLLRAAPPSR